MLEESGDTSALDERSYNPQEMGEDSRKLFVGGLGWDTTEKQLTEYFGKYGELESINVKTNPNTGRSRGFAFIVFTSTESVDKILDGTDHIVNGRKVDPKKAIARTGKIFVGGIKPEISDDDLKNYFSQYGKVVEIEVPFDKQKNQRKGFCFVTFEQEQIVNELLKNPHLTINGHAVDLRKATPKPDMPGMRGAIRGRGRGGFGRGRGYGYNSYGGYGGYGGNYGGYSGGGGGGGGSGGYYDYDYYNQPGYGGYGYGSDYEYSNGYSGGYGE